MRKQVPNSSSFTTAIDAAGSLPHGDEDNANQQQLKYIQGARGNSRHYWCCALICLLVLLFALIRFRLRDMPLERDEGEYAYAGQLMLDGIPPYKLAYNMKFPGTYAAYALILAAFGQTPAGIHLGLLLVNAITTVFVYALAKRLFGALAGVVAGATYAVLSTSPSVLGMAGHATHFVILPAVAGILLLVSAVEYRHVGSIFCSGLLLGLAVTMKQPGIFFAAFGGFYLIWSECRRRPLQMRMLVGTSAVFALGVLLPLLLMGLILLASGVFTRFWFWTFLYAREYATHVPLSDGVQMFQASVRQVLRGSAWLWAISAIGLTALGWNPKSRKQAAFVLGLLLFSFAAVCPSLNFRPHYFILMLPAVAVLAGLAVSSATEQLGTRLEKRVFAALPALVCLAAFGSSLYNHRHFLFQMDPIQASRAVYGFNPFPEAVHAADYIRAHTPEGARIAVLGSEPEIYFYSHRHSATGYIYTYGLMEEQRYASQMQKEMAAEIESAHPEFVVVIDITTSWLPRPGSEEFIFHWAEGYLRSGYQLAGTVVLVGNRTTYCWEEVAPECKTQAPAILEIYRRIS